MVSEVTRNTGFARGLFDATETDSGKVKDKESKTAWLAKIIACVGLALNEKVTARPLKIVAGLEPEHTNAFLQQLARAAKTGDSSEAVRRALAGETPAAAPPKQTHREPSPPPREPSPPPPPPPPARARSPSPEPAFAPPPPPHSDSDDEPPPPPPKRDSSPPPPQPERRAPARPMSARRAPPKISSKVVEVSPIRDGPGTRPESVEGSSRPFEPEPSSNSSNKPSGVFGEGDVADSDDDQSDDDTSANVGPSTANPWADAKLTTSSDPDGGGALVRDMLAAKREGEAAARFGRTDDSSGTEPSVKAGKGIILGSRRKKKASSSRDTSDASSREGGAGGLSEGRDGDRGREGISAATFRDEDESNGGAGAEDDVEAIREQVQALVQFTNPLGKAMDALQEDVETMRRELTFWQRERENMGRRAEEVRSAPLGETVAKQDKRLEEADDEIASMRKKIQSVKAAIHRNDGKIAKLLAMVVTPA